MKKNMGSVDQLVRLVVAITIGIMYYKNIISGTVGITLSIIAIVFLLTSLVGFCPIYSLFGVNTCKTK